ncbi:MAG TPA: TIGR03067 domain-containing protein [Phycisphaerae bacterium]|nr:TIGR03067 domain-containing protein [Phycisphaerae bacterium]
MVRRMGMLVMAGWLAMAAGCQARPKSGTTVGGDAQAIQGRWVVVSCVANGEPVASGELENLTWTFTGHELLWSDGSSFYYAIDPASTPKAIDLRFPENPAEITHGIYTLSGAGTGGGGTLEVCIAKKDGRPKAFASPPGEQQYLYTLRRDDGTAR